MKPLALFGIPHNALVYVFVSYMHMCVYMHMSVFHSSLGSVREGLKRSSWMNHTAKTSLFYLFIDPGL